MAKYSGLKIILTFTFFISFFAEIQAVEQCSDFVKSIRDDSKILSELQNGDQKRIQVYKDDLDCLETMIRTNSFKSAKFLLNK